MAYKGGNSSYSPFNYLIHLYFYTKGLYFLNQGSSNFFFYHLVFFSTYAFGSLVGVDEAAWDVAKHFNFFFKGNHCAECFVIINRF